MNNLKQICIVIMISISAINLSCREPLISSDDEQMEALILGEWIYQGEAASIFLNFKSDLTVEIINSLDTNVFLFNFRIENGDLYFLLVENNQEVEFVYTIESLTSDKLVLSFVDNSGFITRQTYVKNIT